LQAEKIFNLLDGIVGSQYRACALAVPGFRLQLPGLPAGWLLTCRLNFDQTGLSFIKWSPAGWISRTYTRFRRSGF